MFRTFYARIPAEEPEPLPGDISAYRLRRLKSIKNPAQRRQSLGAELLLLRSLELAGELHQPLNISVATGGKPFVDGGPCFSLSHSREMVFCALSDDIVGADVQKILHGEPESGLVRRCMSSRERLTYEAREDKTEFFSLLWSLKESYAKLEGKGLARINPASLDLELDDKGHARIRGGGPCFWYRVEDGYVYTVCSGKYRLPEEFTQVIL